MEKLGGTTPPKKEDMNNQMKNSDQRSRLNSLRNGETSKVL